MKLCSPFYSELFDELFTLENTHYSALAHFSYSLATIINTFAALSLPYNKDLYCFIADIQFNEYTFDGSVNGQLVQNVTNLRLGNWAGCYFDAGHLSGKCLGGRFFYDVIIENLKDNSTHTIGSRWATAFMVAHVVAGVSTLLTLGHKYYPTNFFFFEKLAGSFTILALLPDGVLYWIVLRQLPSLGETIAMRPGNSPALAVGGIVFLSLGAKFRSRSAKDEAGDKGGDGGGGGGVKYTTGSALKGIRSVYNNPGQNAPQPNPPRRQQDNMDDYEFSAYGGYNLQPRWGTNAPLD